ncbi:hypothetical protein [Microvirga massiliensis]|uniref:hypothetical protein n=1 Tax=Microvirga massiliensis TaxID=1033741 RepID=UPI000AF13644|nr:hypothetical protein [Microvirga massiliensis]
MRETHDILADLVATGLSPEQQLRLTGLMSITSRVTSGEEVDPIRQGQRERHVPIASA